MFFKSGFFFVWLFLLMHDYDTRAVDLTLVLASSGSTTCSLVFAAKSRQRTFPPFLLGISMVVSRVTSNM